MRIVSQNGELDFNYDSVTVRRAINLIYAIPTADNDMVLIAEYSTSEKAVQAMHKLHAAYRNMRQLKQRENVFYYDFPKVFHFPADKEV